MWEICSVRLRKGPHGFLGGTVSLVHSFNICVLWTTIVNPFPSRILQDATNLTEFVRTGRTWKQKSLLWNSEILAEN